MQEEGKRKSRSTLKQALKEHLLDVDIDKENLVSPRSNRSILEKTTDDEKVPNSARSNQKLITSEEETSSKKTKSKKSASRERKSKEGRLNQAYESDTNPETKDNNPDKPPRKARRAKKKPEPEVIESPPADSNILAVLIHQTDKLRTDVNIYNPVVRVHLLDLDTDGQYVRKTKKDRHTLIYYEKENRKLDYVSPVMTSSFDFKTNRTILPRWEEVLVFNEDFSHFVKDHPNVLIMFEILDSHKSGDSNTQAKSYTSQDTSKEWQRIAWAFLKIVGSDKSLNTEKKIRLQLYYTQNQYKYNTAESLVPEVFSLYKNGPRVKYPASLHVTIKSVLPPKAFTPGVGSSDLLTNEYFDKTPSVYSNSDKDLKDIAKSQSSLNKVMDVKPDQIAEEVVDKKLKTKTIIWSRLAGLPCRVPNDLDLKLDTAKKGCYTIKFSSTGSYLACACIEDDSTYPINVYEIPNSKFHMRFYGHFGLVYDISWSKLDKYIVTASNDATARVIDVENKSKEAYKILPHPSFLYSAKFHPDSLDIVCTSGYDKVIRIWSINNKKKKYQKYGELLQELNGHIGYVNSICFNSDGNLLYSADSAGEIKVWNCFLSNEAAHKEWTLHEEIEVEELKKQSISFIQLLPNQFRMIIQLRDNQLKLVDIRLKSVVQRYKGTYNFSQNLKSTVTPCGTFLFNCGSDTKVYCWNINSGDQLATASINLNYLKPARDIDFHPYDNFIAFCCYDSNAPVYMFKFNSEKAALDIGQANHQSKESKNFAKTMDMSEYQSEFEELEKETALEKKLREDKEKFDQFKLDRWRAVQEKLDSVYPSKGSKSARNNSDLFSRPISGSIILSMDNSNKPEFKYKGPKEAQDLVVALYDYKSQRGDELDLHKGDEILVLLRENDNWWMGELCKSKKEGYFPASYVQDKASLENIKKGPFNPNKMPKYSVRDAMGDYEKLYEKSALSTIASEAKAQSESKQDSSSKISEDKKSISIIKENTKAKSESQLRNVSDNTSVDIVNEIPTRDESNPTSRKRDVTKRRTFAHTIVGAPTSSSDI